MFGQRDTIQYEEVWRQKAARGDVPTAYRRGVNKRVDRALQLLSSGERLLDIGCGTGVLPARARDRFRDVHGVDVAEAPVRIARRQGVVASIVNLNDQGLPYEDSYFDAVTILGVLHLLYDMRSALREIHRVLRPNGELIVAVPNMRALWRVYRLLVLGTFPRTSMDAVGYDGGALHYFCYRNLHHLLSEQRFRVLRSHGIFCLPKILHFVPDVRPLDSLRREFFSGEIWSKP
jgi:SAM-dependent methyltransferase